MNKKFFSAIAIVGLTMSLSTPVFAAEDVQKEDSGVKLSSENFEKVKIKKLKNFKVGKIKEDRYYFLHSNGEQLSYKKVNEVIPGKIKYSLNENQPEEERQNLYAIGFFKDEGTLYTDYIYDERDVVTSNHLNNKAQSKAIKKLEKANHKSSSSLTTLSTNPQARYIDNYDWTFEDDYNPGTNMGTLSSTVEYRDNGNPYSGNPSKSVWDVKFFNEMTNVNGYQNKEITTRESISGFGAQDIISYAPSQNQDNLSMSFNLGGGFVPVFSWTIQDEKVSVVNDSNTYNGYARWIFDVALGSNNAENTLVTEPGARITNTSGNIGFKHSHRVEFYKNLNANDYGYTGVVTAYKPD